MCGIFGCLRNSNIALPVDITKLIVKALHLLKNRGYDSCGIFLNTLLNNVYLTKFGVDGEIIKDAKREFNIDDIFVLLQKDIDVITNSDKYHVGMGHTSIFGTPGWAAKCRLLASRERRT